MKLEKVKAAVIGCGMISDIYLKNLTTRFSIIEITGVADSVDEKASAQAEKIWRKKAHGAGYYERSSNRAYHKPDVSFLAL